MSGLTGVMFDRMIIVIGVGTLFASVEFAFELGKYIVSQRPNRYKIQQILCGIQIGVAVIWWILIIVYKRCKFMPFTNDVIIYCLIMFLLTFIWNLQLFFRPEKIIDKISLILTIVLFLYNLFISTIIFWLYKNPKLHPKYIDQLFVGFNIGRDLQYFKHYFNQKIRPNKHWRLCGVGRPPINAEERKETKDFIEGYHVIEQDHDGGRKQVAIAEHFGLWWYIVLPFTDYHDGWQISWIDDDYKWAEPIIREPGDPGHAESEPWNPWVEQTKDNEDDLILKIEEVEQKESDLPDKRRKNKKGIVTEPND